KLTAAFEALPPELDIFLDLKEVRFFVEDVDASTQLPSRACITKIKCPDYMNSESGYLKLLQLTNRITNSCEDLLKVKSSPSRQNCEPVQLNLIHIQELHINQT